MEKSWNCVIEFLWEPCLMCTGLCLTTLICNFLFLNFVDEKERLRRQCHCPLCNVKRQKLNANTSWLKTKEKAV